MAFARRLATDVTFYGALGTLERAVTVLLVPVYTRVLSQEDFGNLDLVVATSALVQVLVDMQQAQGFMRLYPEYLRAGSGRQFAGTNLTSRLALGAFAAGVFVLLGQGGYLELGFIPSFARWRATWIAAAVTIPASLTVELLLLQTRMLGAKRLFVVGTLTNVVLSTALCVLLVAGLHWGLLGAVVGQGVGTAVAAGVLAWGLRDQIAIAWDASTLRRVLRHTLPIVPGYWAGSFATHLGRFFVFGELGAASAAILAISIKVASVIALLSAAFRMAWQPLAMMGAGDQRSQEHFSEAMRLFLVAGLLSICGLALVARPIVLILAPSAYAGAAGYIPFLGMATVVGEIESSLMLGNQLSGKTYWMSVTALLGVAVNVVVLALFTKFLGIGAAVVGALASSVLRACVAYVSAQRTYAVRYDRMGFVRFGVGCVLVGVLTAAYGKISSTILAPALAFTGLGLGWMSLTQHEKRLARGAISALRLIRGRSE